MSRQGLSVPSLHLLRKGKNESSEQSISLVTGLAPPRKAGEVLMSYPNLFVVSEEY
jgi:hypothetical protein